MMLVVVTYAVFFFFSSRRRHTRFDCDWSSDVCSSDLVLSMRRSASVAVATAVSKPKLRSQLAMSLSMVLGTPTQVSRSEEHTSELQSQSNLVCRLLLEKKKRITSFD